MSFAERFLHTDEIDVAGRMLRQVWRLDVGLCTLHLARIAADSTRLQGIVLDTDAHMFCAGRTARRLALWADTAPIELEVEVLGPTELRVWNVWADDDLTQAWIGSAAILARTEGGTTRLSCRDGHGDDLEAPLTDLVIDLTVLAAT